MDKKVTADSTVLVPHVEEDAHAGHPAQGVNTALLGMLLFIGSELMFFAGLFGAYFNSARNCPGSTASPGRHRVSRTSSSPAIVPLTATAILIAQLVHDAVGRVAHPQGRPHGHELVPWPLTLIMGVIFLLMQAFDYLTLVSQDGFGINSGIYGSLFFTMTGFHGAHVFGGVVGIGVILLRGLSGQFSAKHHVAVEAVSVYWHFVDVVWIVAVRDPVLPEVD